MKRPCIVAKMVKLHEYRINPRLHIEIHQLLAGREFANTHRDPQVQSIFNAAKSSANFVYCIVVETFGPVGRREASIIDAAWDVDGIFKYCRQKLKVSIVSSCIFTHWHPDHIGGFLPTTHGGRLKISGIPECVANGCSSIYFGKEEFDKVKKMHNIDPEDNMVSNFFLLDDGDSILINELQLEIISTPGHTVGSICVFIPNFGNKPRNFPILITGDTLFIGNCGRFNQNRDGMKIFHSINRLTMLPDTTMVCPGHNYAGSSSSIGHEKKYNAAIMQGKQMKEQLEKAYGKHELHQSIARCDTSANFESQTVPIKRYLERATKAYLDLKSTNNCLEFDTFTCFFKHGNDRQCATCFPIIRFLEDSRM